mmetsp:Transcript_43234/g.70162  ORF Transcript_43234/g.70162 Transcript_43234/m.70162 type:complete len:258 (+) Transcript_43234:74-847(+)
MPTDANGGVTSAVQENGVKHGITTPPPAPLLKAILFDLDGTICHTDHVHFKAFQIMLKEEGLGDIDMDFFNKNISGRHNPLIMKDLLPHLTEEQGREWSTRKEELFRRLSNNLLKETPGLSALLDWMDQQAVPLKRAVVTNAPKLNVEYMLDVLKVRHRFPLVVLGEECLRAKPDPCPYQTAMELLGVKPHETIAFEDSGAGIKSALGAGITTVGITSSFSDEFLNKLGVVFAVPDFGDKRLLSAIQRWTNVGLAPL